MYDTNHDKLSSVSHVNDVPLPSEQTFHGEFSCVFISPR